MNALLLQNLRSAVIAFAVVFFSFSVAHADPANYPAFAQQSLRQDIKPQFIGMDQLVKDISAGVKPVIVDVRTTEEFREAHIAGAMSAPLAEFQSHIKTIPRDRPVVLY